MIVSPEILTSPAFRAGVLSKEEFRTHLRVVSIDEAHCISLWGGSFRPDYAQLGFLRATIPSHVPLTVASATLPQHVLEDIRTKLQLHKDAKVISLTNDRPNVALSVRTMRHPAESFGDLRFLIPEGAKEPADIPVTLVYCNERTVSEQAADTLRRWATDAGLEGADKCIAFYHAKIGSARKREIEEELRKGNIRILIGMLRGRYHGYATA